MPEGDQTNIPGILPDPIVGIGAALPRQEPLDAQRSLGTGIWFA